MLATSLNSESEYQRSIGRRGNADGGPESDLSEEEGRLLEMLREPANSHGQSWDNAYGNFGHRQFRFQKVALLLRSWNS